MIKDLKNEFKFDSETESGKKNYRQLMVDIARKQLAFLLLLFFLSGLLLDLLIKLKWPGGRADSFGHIN